MMPRHPTIPRVQAAFWGLAAAAVGFAVRHRRTLRALPVAFLALSAFALGRAAGSFLVTAF